MAISQTDNRLDEFVEIESIRKTALDCHLANREEIYRGRLLPVYRKESFLTDLYEYHYMGVRDGKHITWQMTKGGLTERRP